MAAGDAIAYAYENTGFAASGPIPAVGYGYENVGFGPPAEYAGVAMRFGPLWYFRNENTTTNLDSSGNGIASNNNYGPSTDTVGLYPNAANPGRARSWPGTGGSTLLNVFGHPGDEAYTLAAAVKVTANTGDWQSVASVVGAIAAAHSCINGFDATGHPLLKCYGGGSEIQLTAPAALDSNMHYVVWRYNKTTFAVDIFVDGTKVASGNNGGAIRPGSGQREYGMANASRYFKGVMDEAVWFPRALSDNEVADLSGAWAGGVLLSSVGYGYENVGVQPVPVPGIGYAYENVVAEVLWRWYDGGTTQPARLKGWWNGLNVQPAKVSGWYDGSTIKPVT